ncbi:MAG: hypothetical protein QXO70_04160 [Candidatus Pacearchaeota archaeon]
MLKLEQKEFKGFIKDLKDRKSKFIIDTKRTVSSIIMGGKFFALSRNKNHIGKDEKKTEIISLFAQVAKSVTSHIEKNNFTVERIPQRHPSSDTNRLKYAKMKIGAEFWYVDVSHCYWRIAFLRKYITPKLYENVLKKPELKIYRNMALACIVAPRKRQYFDDGEMILEITEERGLWKMIYDNIRFTSYNLMGDISKQVEKNFIAYRTDGIMVTKPALPKVKKMLTDAGFAYTVTRCIKIDDGHYYYGKKVKKI